MELCEASRKKVMAKELKIMPFPKALFVVPNRSYKELNNHKIHENDLDKLSELVHEK